MDGIEWVVHSSVLQAAQASDFDAQGFLHEIINHHNLALDEEGQIRQHYTPWLIGNSFVARWFQRVVAGNVVKYPSQSLEDEVQTHLADLGLLNDDLAFVSTTRQTLDQLLAGRGFSPDAREYLRERVCVQVVADWQAAVRHGQALTEARARWLIAQSEGESVEFKSSLTTQLRKGAIETLAAFAVKNGGTVFFGVRDDGSICGVQVGKKTLEDLAWRIQNNTDPSLTAPHLRIKDFDFGGKVVLAVSVDSIPGRECRAYGHVCRRVGRRTQRE